MHGNRRTSTSALPSLPPGARQPAIPNDGYAFELTPPAYEQQPILHNPWDAVANTTPPLPARPRVRSMNDSNNTMREAQSPYAFGGQQRMGFPEPMFYDGQQNFAAAGPGTTPRLTHHYSRSDDGGPRTAPLGRHRPLNASVASFASSYQARSDDVHSLSSSGEVCMLYHTACSSFIHLHLFRVLCMRKGNCRSSRIYRVYFFHSSWLTRIVYQC